MYLGKMPIFQSTPITQVNLLYIRLCKGNWTTVVIPPPNLNSFDQKKSLPKHWAGYLGDEIIEITGKSSAIFCHKNRFICAFSNLLI